MLLPLPSHHEPHDPQVYELLTGEALFDPFFQTAELGLSPEESHLIQMTELLGQIPEELVRAGEHSGRWFNESGRSHYVFTRCRLF